MFVSDIPLHVRASIRDIKYLNYACSMSADLTPGAPLEGIKGEESLDSQPKQKKQKTHKRKLKKMLAPPEITVKNDHLVLPAIRSLAIELAGGNVPSPKEFEVKHKEKVPNVVVCLIPGLLIDDFGKTDKILKLDSSKAPKLPFFGSHFKDVIPLRLPGKANEVYSTERTLINVKITRKSKDDMMEQLLNTPVHIESLFVKMPDWMDHDFKHFPGSGHELPDDWFETKQLDHEPKIFALDCEFCQTKEGSQLARISIVDYDNNVVYDEFVKPEKEIIDYATKFSGITEDIMANATTTQQQVREKLLQTISSSDILVGHSLLFDLNVLKMYHAKIVDTCVIYDHTRKKPFKASLKWLAETYLGRKIQAGEAEGKGHSSVEDSIACLDLVKLKLSKGPLFGQEPDSEPISLRIKNEGDNPVTILDKSMTEWGITSVHADTIRQVVGNSDDILVEKINEATKNSKVVFCKLSEYPKGGDDEQKAKLDEQLNKVWESLPENSTFFVIGGSKVSPKIQKLQLTKLKYNWMQKQGKQVDDPEQVWTFDKDTELKNLVQEARASVCFFGLKTNNTPSA